MRRAVLPTHHTLQAALKDKGPQEREAVVGGRGSFPLSPPVPAVL